jgi:Tfp pilus assembly PilM family ATPase
MPAPLTAIELTETEALVVRARLARGEPTVCAALRVPLPEAADLEPAARGRLRGEALAEGLKVAGQRVGAAVMAISKHRATIRYAILPTSNDKELAQMAQYETERHVPFNPERHTVSHHVLAKDDLAGSRVLLAAADAPELEEVLALSKAAGIDIAAIDVASIGQFNALASTTPPELGEETAVILHMGPRMVDISICSKGVLLFTRSAPLGHQRLASDLEEFAPENRRFGADALRRISLLRPLEGLRELGFEVPDPEARGAVADGTPSGFGDDAPGRLRHWLNRLLQEIQRSHSFAQRELDCPAVGALYLSGEAAAWTDFGPCLEARLNVEARHFTPFGGLPAEGIGDESGNIYNGAFGVLTRFWRPESVRFDLTPPQYRVRQRTRRKQVSALTTVGLAILVAALAVAYLHGLSSVRQQDIEALRDTVAALRPRVDELRDKQKQLNIINRYRQDKRSTLAILDTISSYGYMPRRVALSRFEFVKGADVQMTGHALSLQDLNRFLDDMEKAQFQKAKIFDKVVPRKQQFGQRLGPQRPQELIEFHVQCYIAE